MSKKTNKSISVIKILEEALSALQQVAQWQEDNDYGECAGYEGGAKALIEVVEEFDCGSCGGFSKGQKINKSCGSSGLFYRWEFLAKKYGCKPKKKANKAWMKKIKGLYKRRSRK